MLSQQNGRQQAFSAYGTFFRLNIGIKLKFMKALMEKVNLENDNTQEGFHIGTTIMVILLFLVFMGTSFYLMVTNF
jgi:hypothetical protein